MRGPIIFMYCDERLTVTRLWTIAVEIRHAWQIEYHYAKL